MNRLYFKGRKNAVAFCVFLGLALCLMVIIFYLSSQNAETSSNTSGGLIRLIMGVFAPNFEELSATEQENLVASFQFFTRKSAHAGAYMLLSFFLSAAGLQLEGIKPFFRVAFGWLMAVLYSVSDEIHQLFIPGRSGELRDVFIDSCGAAVGALVVFLLWELVKFQNKKTVSY